MRWTVGVNRCVYSQECWVTHPEMDRGQSHRIAPTDRMINQSLFFGVMKFSFLNDKRLYFTRIVQADLDAKFFTHLSPKFKLDHFSLAGLGLHHCDILLI